MQWRVSTPGPRLPSYSWGDCVVLAISPSWGLLPPTSPGALDSDQTIRKGESCHRLTSSTLGV